jgi:hypothetical protein
MFEPLFLQSKGEPIEYKGKLVQLMDRPLVRPGSALQLVFVSSSGSRRQGVRIKANGDLVVAGQKLKDIVLWSDTAPPCVDIQLGAKATELKVWNCWESADGAVDAWHNGAGMIVSAKAAGVREYQCNDGAPNDDFSDLVFRLEGLAT